MTSPTQTIYLPLSPILDEDGSVARELQKPGVHTDTADYPIISTKCTNCNRESTLQCKGCKEALYCSKDCQSRDADIHGPLCRQAARFCIDDDDTHPNRFRVLVLHAQENKVEFAWATKNKNCLEVVHPALSEFKLRLKDADATKADEMVVGATEYELPELLNVHIRDFQLGKFLGHCVLLWTLCDWKEMPIEWLNQTALSLGGKPGHTNLFYVPMVVTVFKQDMVDLQMRTLDHVQMRTLRQVVDYIQMAFDNPCVPNPDRFIPLEGPEPIRGVKINNHLERQLMRPYGMCDAMEDVSLNPRCPKAQLQWAAAIPFILGLKWVVRTAELDMVKPRITRFHADVFRLAWFQWQLNPFSQTGGPNKRRATVEHNRTSCSIVVFQAGGAPLETAHIQALLDYIASASKDAGIGTKDLSKAGFEAFWKANCSFDGAPSSPYELEASHAGRIDGEHFDEVLALIEADQESLVRSIRTAPVEPWAILKALSEIYPLDKHVMRVWGHLFNIWWGLDYGRDSIDRPTVKDTSGSGDETMETEARAAAAQTARDIANTLTEGQLGWCMRYFVTEPQDALDAIRKGRHILDSEPFR